MPSNAHIYANTTWNWTKPPPKRSEISRLFQQYAYDHNILLKIEFKMLEKNYATWFKGLGAKPLQ